MTVGIGSSGVHNVTSLNVGGTEVIDSSRNLVNVVALTMTGDLTVDTNTLFVDASENDVGIGTTTPFVSIAGVISPAINGLEIEKTGSGAALVIDSDTSSNIYFGDSGATADSKIVNFNFGDTSNVLIIRTINDSNGVARTIMTMAADTGKVTITAETELDGDLNHDGSNIGFFGVAPAVRASAYTASNVTTDRSYDADSTSTAELADILGTLSSDLTTYGLLQ